MHAEHLTYSVEASSLCCIDGYLTCGVHIYTSCCPPKDPGRVEIYEMVGSASQMLTVNNAVNQGWTLQASADP